MAEIKSSNVIKSEKRRKPTQRRSRETIEKILISAAYILESFGLESLNTNFLAKQSNIAVGTIYQYFNNKDEIIKALLVRQQQKRILVLRDQIFELKNTSLEEMVEGLIRSLYGFQKKSPRLEQILLEKQYTLNLAQFEEDLDRRLINLLQKYIALNAIEFNVDNLNLSLRILVTAIKATTTHFLFDQEAPDEEVIINELKNLTLRYVR